VGVWIYLCRKFAVFIFKAFVRAQTFRARFLGLFRNENRKNGNGQNYWNVKEEQNDMSKNGVKTNGGFPPQAW